MRRRIETELRPSVTNAALSGRKWYLAAPEVSDTFIYSLTHFTPHRHTSHLVYVECSILHPQNPSASFMFLIISFVLAHVSLPSQHLLPISFIFSAFPSLLPVLSAFVHVSFTDTSWSLYTFKHSSTWECDRHCRRNRIRAYLVCTAVNLQELVLQRMVSIPESHCQTHVASGKSSVLSSLLWGYRASLAIVTCYYSKCSCISSLVTAKIKSIIKTPLTVCIGMPPLCSVRAVYSISTLFQGEQMDVI